MRIIALSALALLPGCSFFVPQWEGVWLLEMPVESDGSTATDLCNVDCNENFSDAECFEIDAGTTDWTYNIQQKLSAEAYFIEIFNGKGGEVFGVINDEIYVGTASVKQLDLAWRGTTDSDNKEEHDDGYEFQVIDLSETFDKIVITKGPKGQATGSWTVQSLTQRDYIESDEWDPIEVGVGGGQIPSYGALEGDELGDNQNSAEGDECSGGECELSLSSECDFGKRNFSASYAGKYENGMFQGIARADQPAGAGGGTTVTP